MKRQIYFKILITIIIVLWFIYFLQTYYVKEGFTGNIKTFYRPYIRKINQSYETFIDNYGPKIIVNKLKKWNIY